MFQTIGNAVVQVPPFAVYVFTLARFPNKPFLQTARSCTSSSLSLNCLTSSAMYSFTVFLPYPFPLKLTCFYKLTPQSSAYSCSLCSNHQNLPWRTTSDTLTIKLAYFLSPHLLFIWTTWIYAECRRRNGHNQFKTYMKNINLTTCWKTRKNRTIL